MAATTAPQATRPPPRRRPSSQVEQAQRSSSNACGGAHRRLRISPRSSSTERSPPRKSTTAQCDERSRAYAPSARQSQRLVHISYAAQYRELTRYSSVLCAHQSLECENRMFPNLLFFFGPPPPISGKYFPVFPLSSSFVRIASVSCVRTLRRRPLRVVANTASVQAKGAASFFSPCPRFVAAHRRAAHCEHRIVT